MCAWPGRLYTIMNDRTVQHGEKEKNEQGVHRCSQCIDRLVHRLLTRTEEHGRSYVAEELQSPLDLLYVGLIFRVDAHHVFDRLVGMNNGAVIAAAEVKTDGF